MNKKILFIINPISGAGKNGRIEKIVDKYLDKSKYTPYFSYTKASKHAIELSRDAANQYDIVTAIGGDGTINEVSQGLLGSNTALAIIPAGSGNGFARFFHVPLDAEKAVQIINNGNIKRIDTMNINAHKFANVAGTGFDALISIKFANYGKRGIFPYIKLVAKEFWSYKSLTYHVEIDGKSYNEEAFLLTFANSSQFGANAHIAPLAAIDDGLIDVCFLKKCPWYAMPKLVYQLFAKKLHHSKYLKIVQGKHVIVTHNQPLIVHLDGEPYQMENKLELTVNPLSLDVVIGL